MPASLVPRRSFEEPALQLVYVDVFVSAEVHTGDIDDDCRRLYCGGRVALGAGTLRGCGRATAESRRGARPLGCQCAHQPSVPAKRLCGGEQRWRGGPRGCRYVLGDGRRKGG
jgi:hypothetical protein